MPKDHIRYDILAQDALRGVIRKVLSEVAATGHLPGNHHFFITFLTQAPGVRISPRLREKYPEQMTIVLQHQFWDLKVTETAFEVGLSFSDQPEKLLVPFSAVRGFYDPAVNFELEFDTAAVPEESAGPSEVVTGPNTPVPSGEPARIPAKPTPVKQGRTGQKTKPAARQVGGKASAAGDKDEAPQEDKSGAEVVSLDSFRKKT